jgi:diguanylate cyclase (GGDEF)-like protein
VEVKQLGLSQMDLIIPEDRTRYLCLVNEQIARTGRAYFEHRILRKDGSTLYVFCHGKQNYDPIDNSAYAELIIADSMNTSSMRSVALKERLKAQNRLKHWESKYRCDSLTGLLNHEAFKSDVEIRLLEGKTRVVMLMMDVDEFKRYNDTYGHLAGDDFLIMVAKLLRESLRAGDLACRMGGDEFAVVLDFGLDVTDEVIKERIRQIFEHLNRMLRSVKGNTSLSMGCSISSTDLQTFNQLYEAADQALYHSKSNGRACLSLYGEYDN